MSIRPPAISACAAVAALAFGFGCGRVVLEPPDEDAGNDAGKDGGTTADGPGAERRDGDSFAFELLGAPLIFAPTAHGFGLSVVLRQGPPSALRARAHDEALTTWIDLGPPTSPAADVAQWIATRLQPGRRYTYQICAGGGDSAELTCDALLYTGSAATAPPPGTAFTFAAMADSHIAPRDPIPPGATVADDVFGTMEATLGAVTADIAAADPDFIVNMGDLLDYHLFGFNTPPPDAKWSRLAYLNYRRMMGDTLGRAAHFPVIGNWDGESGCNSTEEIQRSMTQRLLYIPAPAPGTHAEGGSANQDYYAFTWGDALFVVLNVMTYTPSCHLLGLLPGLPDDWTLGAAQLAWLEKTLANATSKWRFTFIHHTVGGKAGNDIDSAYGRGGGQAARIGEQSLVHDLLLRHGVQIFFYAHDHVFTDMVVDGIHYTLPGSAGAPWKFTTAETGYADFWPDSGFGRVRVEPTSVTVDFVAMGGSVISSYTLR